MVVSRKGVPDGVRGGATVKKNRLDEGAGYEEGGGKMGLEQRQIPCPRNVDEASKEQG